MNTIAYFEIQSADPAKAASFYKDAFGWEFELDAAIPIPYYRLTSGGMMGAILKRPTAPPPVGQGTNAFVCSVQVESFDATAAIILKNGGQIALPKFAIPGRCWQGYFLDPDHNTFGLFETDQHAA